MNRLLYIQASPRGERSKSIQVADAFLQAHRKEHPGDKVTVLNTAEMRLPPFDGASLDAKYAILHGQKLTAEQAKAWKVVEAVMTQFKAADKYVFAVPMWNFNVPYRLKHYIDVITQPTYLFSYDPEHGYTGLVTGRPALVVCARGGEYSDPGASSYDHQKPYLDLWLRFIGFTDIQSIVIEPTLMGGPEVAHDKVAAAIEQAKALAPAFGAAVPV